MKKLGALSLVLLLAASALFADDGLAVTGDARTGLVFEKVTDTDPEVYMGDNEGTPGRVQINFTWTKGNFLMKWTSRFEGDQLANGVNAGSYSLTLANNLFSAAYGAATFLDGQFRLGIGKLDDAVWASGGDDGGNDFDSVSGARFEIMPGILPGLNFGFSLPAAFSDTGTKLNPADYFAELIYGVKYDNDFIDLRVAFKGDGEGDGTYDTAAGTWSRDDAGARLIYGADLKFLGSLLPGFGIWLNGDIQGIETNDKVLSTAGYTSHWANIKYSVAPLEVYVRAAFQTWADNGKTWGTAAAPIGTFAKNAIIAKIGGSYAITSWLKPSVWAQLLFYSYDDNFKVGTEDPAALGEFAVEPAADFILGNGLTITPLLNIKVNPADSPDSGSGDAKISTKFKINLTYEF
jgi:hypothetical protein